MSEAIDADFGPEVHERLLAEVRDHLPAFLYRGATELHDPAGDVRALLNLEAEELDRVIAVHQCLDLAVLEFGRGLAEGLRRPLASSRRPPEVGQSVRGPIDWGVTASRRALQAGDESLFVVRSAQRVFDIAENRAIVWLLERLRVSLRGVQPPQKPLAASVGTEPLAWWQRIELLRQQVHAARQVQWLRRVKPEKPSPLTLRRLRSARDTFYARAVAGAVESVLRLTSPDEDVLTDVLSQRYFRPTETWRLFELAVALRLAKAFSEVSPMPRRSRLLVGVGKVPFARYGFKDGSEVSLIYQGWPDGGDGSMRRQAGEWHGLRAGVFRPDIFIVRSGPVADAAVVELKASSNSRTLGGGLRRLLAYLADRPDLWSHQPAGWLVAPGSSAFRDRDPIAGGTLWMVSAEQVAAAAVHRFAPAEPA